MPAKATYTTSSANQHRFNYGPQTAEEFRRKLLDGSSYVFGFDWEPEAFRPAEPFPREIYGNEGGNRSQKFWFPHAVQNRWQSKDWSVFEDDNGEPWNDLDHNLLAQTYFLSDTAKRRESFLYKHRIGPYRNLNSLSQEARSIPAGLELGRAGLAPDYAEEDEEDPWYDMTFQSDVSDDRTLRGSVVSSRESSVESDILSISSTSEDGILWASNPDDVSPLVDAMAHRLVEGYRRMAVPQPFNKCPAGIDSHGTAEGTFGSGGSQHPGQPNLTTIQPFRALCRWGGDRGDEGKGGSDEEEPRRRTPRRPKEAHDGTPTKPLACPFWKLDPSEYRGCFKFLLNDSSRVKQHLRRNHSPKFYCECCREIFHDGGTHRRHVDSQSCTPQSHRFVGITHQQRRNLSGRPKPKLSEEDRWFAIWDIVFPGKPRPASPYLDANLSEDLSRFRGYAQTHGPALIAAEMRRNGVSISPLPGAQAASTLEQTISHGFALMFDAWLAQRTPSPSVPQTTPSPDHPFSTAFLGNYASPITTLSIHQETPASSTLLPENSAMDSIPREEPRVPQPPHEHHHGEQGGSSSAHWDGSTEDEVGAEFIDWEQYSFAYDALGLVDPATQNWAADPDMTE